MTGNEPEHPTEHITAEGRCLCGNARYHVEGETFGILNCHCTRCRKHTGAAFVSFVIFESGRITWLDGQDRLKFFSHDTTTRTFCPDCGSTLPAPHRQGENPRAILAGNCVDMPPTRNVFHVFTGSRAPWYEVPRGVPQWETVAPQFTEPAVGELMRHRESDRITGSCLCGEVTFAATEPLRMMNCHCTRCRLSRAAAHATNVFVSGDNFEWRSGADRVQTYKLPGAARFGSAFCRDCGSLTPRYSRERVSIPAGCLDSDPGIAPLGHIFTGSKAPWFTIDDDLPQWEERPPQ